MTGETPTILDDRDRERAVDALRAGGVVILPTDTLYGFSAALSAGGAVERIARIKGAPARRRFVLLADSVSMVERYASWPRPADRRRLSGVWPAPLTAILASGPACPAWVGDTVAFRVPALAGLLEIIGRLGEPLVSTSVNRSGEPPLSSWADVLALFAAQVDFALSGPMAPGAPSTIVDFTGERPKVVREGAYAWDGSG